MICIIVALIILGLVNTIRPNGFCKKVNLCHTKVVKQYKKICKKVKVNILGKTRISNLCNHLWVPTKVKACD